MNMQDRSKFSKSEEEANGELLLSLLNVQCQNLYVPQYHKGEFLYML